MQLKIFYFIQVNNNGALSFINGSLTYTPQKFPLNNSVPVIAPFWADIDTQGIGNVWYRETTDQDIVLKVRDIVLDAFPSTSSGFTAAELIFIGTWERVGYFNFDSKTNKVARIII